MTPTHFAARLALFYAAIFLVMGVHLPYFPVWLESQGLSEFEISIVIAAPLLLRIFITPAIAVYTDHAQRHQHTILILALGTLAATLCLSQLNTFFAILPVSIFLTVCASTMLPLTETLAAFGTKQRAIDYGRMRLWGSLTFIAASFAAGALLRDWPASIIIWLLTAGAGITVVAALALPRPFLQEIGDVKQSGRASLAGAVMLVRSPLFLTFLLAAGCVHASHATYYAFASLQWLDQGISSVTVSALWAAGILTEVVLFAFSSRVVQWISPLKLLLIGAIAGVLRWSMMTFAPALDLLWPLQVLHALTYGATHLGAFFFIGRAVPESLATTAQAIYATIGTGTAIGIATLVSGALVPTFGFQSYWAMAAIALLGMIAALFAIRLWDGVSVIHCTSMNRAR